MRHRRTAKQSLSDPEPVHHPEPCPTRHEPEREMRFQRKVSIHDVKRRVCRVRNWWWSFRFGRPVSNERRLCGWVAENLLARKAVGCLVLRRG